MAVQIQTRNDTAANWASANPVLAVGEAGYDETNNQVRYGDGVNTWSALTPIAGGAGITLEQVQDDLGNTSLVAGTGITKTYDDGANTITLAIDTAAEAERARDTIGAALVAGANVTITVNDAGDTVTIAAAGGAGATNLTWTAATSVVASDTGTDATLTAADGTNPGLMTSAQFTKLADIEALADVTDAANVAAAGAVMDTGAETIAGIKTFTSSPLVPGPTTEFQAATKGFVEAVAVLDSEVDVDIKTLALPANTTISTFGASLVDDADAAAARATLGVPAATTVAPTVVATAAEYAAIPLPDPDTVYFIVN